VDVPKPKKPVRNKMKPKTDKKAEAAKAAAKPETPAAPPAS
jgi:hypothetical protein